jgi:uncharacterized membrane protein
MTVDRFTTEQLTGLVEAVRALLDLAGVSTVALGVAGASLRLLVRVVRDGAGAYRAYRQAVGRAVLLGLELLVAADILGTVVIDPDLRSVGVLAVVVLVRTILSLSLQVELDERWPWQPGPPALGPAGEDRDAPIAPAAPDTTTGGLPAHL